MNDLLKERIRHILACFVSAGTMLAGQLQADQYALDRFTVAGGGTTFQTTGSYEISGTIGQAGAGVMMDHCFISVGGFWAFAAADTLAPTGADFDLAVTVTDSPDPVLVGSNLTYSIEVENLGSTPATGVLVTNFLPAGVAFVSAASPQAICTGTSMIVCDFGTLAGGGCGSVTIVVTPTIPGLLTNTTSIAANQADPQSLNNRAAQVTTVLDHLPVNYTWTGDTSSEWFNAVNWAPAGVPGLGDTATINSGFVNLPTSTNVATLNLNGGTLDGNGELYVTVAINWTGGVMQGSGATTIAAGGTLNISGPSQKTLLSRTLNNAGTVVWTGAGAISGHTGPVINNLAGALFDLQSDATFDRFNNGVEINNAGIFRKSGGTGSQTFELYSGLFNNTGTLEVRSGALYFNGPVNHSGTATVSSNTYIWLGETSTNSGVFNLATNASVYFAIGDHQLNSGVAFTGAGFARVASGRVLVNSTVGAENFEIYGANAYLDGPGTLIVSNLFNWTGGVMQGSGATTIAAGGLMNISGANNKTLLSRTLNNAGTVVWTGAGAISGHTGPVINNLAGALFDLQSDATFDRFNNGAVINNAGTFRKSGGTGSQTFDLSSGGFNNTGTVEVHSGSLYLNGPVNHSGMGIVSGDTYIWLGETSTNSGVFNLATNGSVYFANSDHQLNNGAAFTGAGFARVASGRVLVNSTVSAENFEIYGANAYLDGPGTLLVSNLFNWTAGTMQGSGATTIPAGGVMNISGANNKTLLSRTLNNAGTMVWTGAGAISGHTGPVINNLAGALFDLQSDAALGRFNNGAVINNTGTFRKSGGTGTQTFDLASGGFNNTGTLDLRTGVLALDNLNYSPGAGSEHRFAVGGYDAGTGFGKLQVSGTISLAGRLELMLTNGFVPTNASTFAVITANPRNGSFSSVTGRGIGGGLYFNPTYPANGVTLMVADGTASIPTNSLARVNGRFQFRLQGVASESYRIDTSTNLLTWSPIATTAIPGSGFLDFTDSDSANFTYRFYRAIFLP